MSALQKHLSKIRVPSVSANVYKDECVYSYDTPDCKTGLYISLTSFLGFGEDFVHNYAKKSGNCVFLRILREKTEIPSEKIGEGPEKKITRLAIGVEGGFDPDAGKKKFEYNTKYFVVVLPERETWQWPEQRDDLPLIVQESVQAIIAAESATSKIEKEALTGTWDGEVRQESKYAKDLKQLDNRKKIPPSGWKCEKCDLTNNLWLNLTDGSILCGRRFFDGSGGNDHAVEHYKQTGYPLAVKLGTISSDGKGDVYSYAEDDMVEDPYLADHLAHFGIKVTTLKKTEKSMVELELDLNQRVGEWSVLTESSSKLVPISGPGYTGMQNLGNSCYLNSVMQVMFIIPDFIKRFVESSPRYFEQFPSDPAKDFDIQMAKLGTGLWSGKYGINAVGAEAEGISPVMFKSIIGREHPDFSTKKQQDAQEFFLHLVNVLERNSSSELNPCDALKFCVEDRVECTTSRKVKYTRRGEWCLPLPIPLDKASNIQEVKEYEKLREEAEKTGKPLPADSIVRPHLTLRDCLDSFAQSELVEQYYSTAIKGHTTAKKTARLATFPDYLLLHLKKFTLKEDWTPIKLDVSIDVPDTLDLSDLRATGLQPGEEELPELESRPPTPPMDQSVLNELMEMGFPQGACKRALFFTKNAGLETAVQWLMRHVVDDDFNDPFVHPGTDGAAFEPNPMGMETIISMGFTEGQAKRALKENNNDLDRAMDWILANPNPPPEVPEKSQPKFRDGNSKYRLVAFISHMGTSSQVGHYVCHIWKKDQWVIFNDEKVAISQNPPKELGYLYLYERMT